MDMPTIFSIETVLGCNLRCLECAVGKGLINRKYGQMSLEQYMVIHHKIKNYAKVIYLHLWGEPLLNKNILAMTRMASSIATANLSTNANMITEKYAVEIIASGVQSLIVSIDGVTQRTYGLYRRNGDVQKALQGLVHLLVQKEKQKSSVHIMPQFIVFEHNKHEMSLFEKFCKELGTVPVFKAPYIREGSYLKDSGIPQYTRPHNTPELERKQNMRACAPEDSLTILLDGNVVACCYDHDGQTSFGNIFEQTMEEIVAGAPRMEFYSRLALGDTPDFCINNCLQY